MKSHTMGCHAAPKQAMTVDVANLAAVTVGGSSLGVKLAGIDIIGGGECCVRCSRTAYVSHEQ